MNCVTKHIKNERGSVTILFALGIICVGSLVVLQMSNVYQGVHLLHAAQKQQFSTAQALKVLALQMKQNYNLAKIDADCSGSHLTGMIRKEINGAAFCLPQTEKLCVDITNEESGDVSTVCASTRTEALRWNEGATDAKTINELPKQLNSSSVVRNKITVPTSTDAPPWRSCAAPAACVRLVLCPMGQDNCSLGNSVAQQIVRFGNID